MNKSRQPYSLRFADISLAYLLLRIVIGINYFNHGVTRIGNIPGFANSIVQNWGAASSQLIYTIVLFILLAGLGYNRFSLDAVMAHRKRRNRESAS